MEQIRSYLISVVCTALICGVSMKLLSSKGSAETVMKLITGMIMTFALLQPFTGFDFSDITKSFDLYSADAQNIVSASKVESQKALRAGIKQRTEAYILDKAQEMKVNISVRVEVSDDDLPVPKTVHISGQVSPYVKSKLQSYIASDLGISKENQKWT